MPNFINFRGVRLGTYDHLEDHVEWAIETSTEIGLGQLYFPGG